METLSRSLRQRAQQLHISNAAAARRIGLDERRYAHYASGRREPDLTTLLKIAAALGTTPNSLLGIDGQGSPQTPRSALFERLESAAKMIDSESLKLLVIQAEAIASCTYKDNKND